MSIPVTSLEAHRHASAVHEDDLSDAYPCSGGKSRFEPFLVTVPEARPLGMLLELRD